MYLFYTSIYSYLLNQRCAKSGVFSFRHLFFAYFQSAQRPSQVPYFIRVNISLISRKTAENLPRCLRVSCISAVVTFRRKLAGAAEMASAMNRWVRFKREVHFAASVSQPWLPTNVAVPSIARLIGNQIVGFNLLTSILRNFVTNAFVPRNGLDLLRVIGTRLCQWDRSIAAEQTVPLASHLQWFLWRFVSHIVGSRVAACCGAYQLARGIRELFLANHLLQSSHSNRISQSACY